VTGGLGRPKKWQKNQEEDIGGSENVTRDSGQGKIIKRKYEKSLIKGNKMLQGGSGRYKRGSMSSKNVLYPCMKFSTSGFFFIKRTLLGSLITDLKLFVNIYSKLAKTFDFKCHSVSEDEGRNFFVKLKQQNNHYPLWIFGPVAHIHTCF
jgi:hypothetical protein